MRCVKETRAVSHAALRRTSPPRRKRIAIGCRSAVRWALKLGAKDWITKCSTRLNDIARR